VAQEKFEARRTEKRMRGKNLDKKYEKGQKFEGAGVILDKIHKVIKPVRWILWKILCQTRSFATTKKRKREKRNVIVTL